MPEVYTTLGQSTLASGYTSGGVSLVLNSGSSFPSTGNFRVRVENEIFKVTARSSGTLTVVGAQEGTSASNHSSGATCTEVVTALALDAIRSDQNAQGVLASLPSSAKQGDAYKATDGYYDYFFNGSVWVPKYRGMICTIPTQTFGFKNQQSATVVTSKGPTILTVPAGTVNFTLYACPVTPPFTAVALINIVSPSRAYTASGFFAYGSSNDHFTGPAFAMEANIYLARLVGTNFTNFSTGQPVFHPFKPLWVKILDNTTNLEMYISTDGLDWVLVYSEATGTTVTVTHVGIGAGKDTNSPGCDNQVALYSLVIT